MSLKKSSFLYLFIFLFCFNKSFSQVSQSPYTIKGIGDIYGASLTHNEGMGGLGISNGNPEHLNILNPALLTNNRFSVFEIGALGEYRLLSTDSLSQQNGGGNLNYVIFGFPVISGRWVMSFGIKPYSNVNYNILTTTEVEGNELILEQQFEGSGGLNELFLSNGVALNKNFSVGATASFLFGQIADRNIVSLDTGAASFSYKIAHYDRVSFSDFNFSAGISYKGKIKENNFINLGATYDFETKINADKLERIERLALSDDFLTADTTINEMPGYIILPAGFGGGISYGKENKWLVGVDFSYQDWARYRNFDDENDGLGASYKLILGGEYTPNITSVNRYFSRVTYRGGFNFEKTPFVVDNNQLTDFGINFGLSLPISKFSSVNLAFRYGQRGIDKEIKIKEQYIKFYFGVTINDKWFIRRKYN